MANSPAASIERWTRRHQSALLLALVVLGAILRALLVLRSPTPYGYVFDFYHEAIQKLYALGRLPVAADCWQCYHPPLLPLLGLPLYALGKAVSGGPAAGLGDPALRFVAPLSLVCGAITAYYSYRILRLYRFRGVELIVGTALILIFPCLLISSYGIEADILLTALMTAFLYYLLKFLHLRRAHPAAAVRLGVLAGLACATKYTGVLAPAILVAAAVTWKTPPRLRSSLTRGVLLAIVVCVAIGSWKYLDNVRQHGTPFFANGSAQQGFSISERPSFWRRYDFTTLRLGRLLRLVWNEERRGPLTDLPFYRSVWTTMHAMAWSDMTLFSDPSRHGYEREIYPRKAIYPELVSSVLCLGLVPDGLAIAGVVVTLRRRALWPLALTAVITWTVYVAWFVAQESWALKTKYILFLLPIYVVYTLLGLRWLRRLSVEAGTIALLLLASLVVSAHLYLLNFAWG